MPKEFLQNWDEAREVSYFGGKFFLEGYRLLIQWFFIRKECSVRFKSTDEPPQKMMKNL